MALKARSGTWYLVIKINGTLHRRSTGFPVGSAAAKDSAKRRASEIELEIRSGNLGWTKPEAPTVREWWGTYKAEHLPQKSERTQRRDTSNMDCHALPFFGGMRLDEVKKSDCLRYINERRKAVQANPKRKTPGTIAEGTVQRERSFLQAFFEQAVADGHLDKNPWRGIERIAYEVRDRVVTQDEQEKLLSVLAPKFQRFVLFLLATGLRLEECRTIRPTIDVDWVRFRVTVTGKGDKTREVPLQGDAVRILQAQLTDVGSLWTQNPQRLREVLRKAAKRAKIPHISPHTLRHTFGWRWIADGGDIYVLSKILGHASVAVTERHYAHVKKDDLARAMEARNLGVVFA